MHALHLPEPARSLVTSRAPRPLRFATAALLSTLLAACDQAQPPTDAREPMATAEHDVQATPAEITTTTTSGSFSLPINHIGSTSSPTPLFKLTQTGTGPNGQFHISSTTNPSAALRGFTFGTGRAGEFIIQNSSNSSPALYAHTNGPGPALDALAGSGPAGRFQTGGSSPALVIGTGGSGEGISAQAFGTGIVGRFSINNSNNGAPVLYATTFGTGPVLRGTSKGGPGLEITSGGGSAGDFELDNTSNSEPALLVKTRGTGPAGSFKSTNPTSSSPALYATTSSPGPTALFETGNFSSGSPVLYAKSIGGGASGGSAGLFENTSVFAENPALVATTNGSGPAFKATTKGTGWAGIFQTASGNGVQITTGFGHVGLQVIGGTKSAVVATSSGARAFYTEESSEVWFTDYGFGKLTNGHARLPIDPTFAQTVNTEERYHVFVQPYGDAELYVTNRTSLGFEVRLRGGDPGVEFSYRVVAKRRGFEATRLERAPWADAAAPGESSVSATSAGGAGVVSHVA